ncbi:MAG: hypothetical protein AAGG01_23495 [Planctomycetota bacterium]
MIEFMLYAAAGLLVSLVVSELIARAWIKSQDRWYIHQPYSRRRFTIATDVLPQLPAEARFEANGDGERGGPVPANPAATQRVLVAGGSAAECFLLDQDDTWSAVLQRELQEIGGPDVAVHVGNVARSLITCRKINAILAKVLPKLESLDAVVLMVGASDLVDWFEAKTPPAIDEGDFEIGQYCAENPLGPFLWKPKKTALYQLARGLNIRLRRPIEIKKNAGASIAKHRAARASAETIIRETPAATPMLKSFEKHLNALIDTCLQHAKTVVVAQQPWLDRDFTPEEAARLWNFGQGSPYRGQIEAYYEINEVRRLMGEVDEVARRVADERGVLRVDLRDSVPSDFEHYYDFLHHSPKGCQLVGRAVAEALTGTVTGSLPSSLPRSPIAV